MPQFTNFGFDKILSREKTKKIKNLFSEVATSYDLMNDLMSIGSHHLWKKRFVGNLPLNYQDKVLDLASGTGDLSIILQTDFNYKNLKSFSYDLTYEMLSLGRDKMINQGLINNIYWCAGAGEQLPFPDNSFNLITVSFGLRNMTDILAVLQECYRVLKTDGFFYCLEFSHMENPYLAKFYDWYSFKILPIIGKKIANNQKAYEYLVESIRTFPKPQELLNLLTAAKFQGCNFSLWMGGIVAVHSGQKL